MKRVVVFVLALFAVAIANEEEDLKHLAEEFKIDVQTMEACMQEAETNIMEIRATYREMMETMKKSSKEEINEETKKSFIKHGHFLKCMLESKDMMKDSKLVLDKILEDLEIDSENAVTKEKITQCVNGLNEADVSAEERALGLLWCFMNNEEENSEK